MPSARAAWRRLPPCRRRAQWRRCPARARRRLAGPRQRRTVLVRRLRSAGRHRRRRSARRPRAPGGLVAARASSASMAPSRRMAARRITLRSSRTLPGQSWDCSRASRLGRQLGAGRPRRPALAQEVPGQQGRTSPGRCRSGGSPARSPTGGGTGRAGRRPRWTSRQRSRKVSATTRTSDGGSRPARPRAAAARSPAPAAAWAAAPSGSSPISSSTSVPPDGLLEPARAPAGRPGEGAALVTEQLALRQLARQRPAVDGHVGAVGVGAQLVQDAGEQLLAGAAFRP